MNDKISVSTKNHLFIRAFKLFIGFLFVFFSIFLYQNYNRCDLPMEYKVGAVDSRFQISEQEVKEVADAAAKRWNEAVGQNVLLYNPNAKMTIDLVYDQRQASLDELKKNINTLETKNLSITDWSKELDSMIAMYESDLKEYESRTERYNKDVEYWNYRGGAPETVFNQLDAEKEKLRQEYARLEATRKSINQISELLNEKATDYNSDLGKIKDTLDQNKNKIVTQGLYYIQEKRIDIFTFGDKKELQLVLMHELGHSMGLGHVENEKATMNSLLGGQDVYNPTPIKEDLDHLNSTCRIDSRMINVPFLNLIFNRLRETTVR